MASNSSSVVAGRWVEGRSAEHWQRRRVYRALVVLPVGRVVVPVRVRQVVVDAEHLGLDSAGWNARKATSRTPPPWCEQHPR